VLVDIPRDLLDSEVPLRRTSRRTARPSAGDQRQIARGGDALVAPGGHY